MRRGVSAVAAAIAAGMLLTSCTPGIPFGARLNADGTVDHVVCYGDYGVHVDYISPSESVVEWEPLDAAGERIQGGGVLYYGQALQGVPTQAAPPPEDWTEVDLTVGDFLRSELEEGRWVWETEYVAFIPDRPCGDFAYLEDR